MDPRAGLEPALHPRSKRGVLPIRRPRNKLFGPVYGIRTRSGYRDRVVSFPEDPHRMFGGTYEFRSRDYTLTGYRVPITPMRQK